MDTDKTIALAAILFVCGCMSSENATNSSLNAKQTIVGATPVVNTTDEMLHISLYDNYRGELTEGILVGENGLDLPIGVDGANVRKGNLTQGEYLIITGGQNNTVYLPFTVDERRMSEFEGRSDYVIGFDGRELYIRYFMVLDQDMNALNGVFSLDNESIGQTSQAGVASVPISLLHPGTLGFAWMKKGNATGFWELDYTEADMRYLFLKLPVDTTKTGASVSPSEGDPSAVFGGTPAKENSNC